MRNQSVCYCLKVYLRHLDTSTILFANDTFSVEKGFIVGATKKSSVVKHVLELAKNSTEEKFTTDIDEFISDDEVSSGKFRNKDPHSKSKENLEYSTTMTILLKVTLRECFL